MAKHYNTVTPKVPKEVLIGFGVVLAVILSLFLLTLRSNEQRIYDIYEEARADLSTDHPFYEVTFNGSLFNESLESRINSGELILLYIGSPQCPACVQTIGTVSDYFFSEGLDELTSNIYYYEDFAGVAASRDRNAFLEAYPDITRSTPQVIAFLDGEIIARYQAPTEGVTIERQVKNFFTAVLDQVK
jgi:hypothetical protein